MDVIRVLRILEYVGPREAVEEQLKHSIHGERRVRKLGGEVVIRAATLGEFPEVMGEIKPCHLSPGQSEESDPNQEVVEE